MTITAVPGFETRSRKNRWETSEMLRQLILLFLIVTSPLSAPAKSAEPLRIRVLSYNIHHGEGVDGKLDLNRIAQVILSVSPDVVAVQEVDRKTVRTNRVDQPAELSRLTDMEILFEKNIDFQDGEYGNAVLSNLPVVKHENVHLPSLGGGEQRGVLIVELKPEAIDETILFLGTHLDHRSDDRERLASAARINELIQQRDDQPAILAGDLNATPDSAVLTTFGKKWSRSGQTELPTIPVTQPNRQIDYVLFRPADRWRVVEVRVLDEAVASDHRAILAVIELLPRPE
jgi:endonuclease/exonuclease/phosphatase family metal-dependent hydrolase